MSQTILIVEDNENNSSLLKDILLYHGYQVAVASDGQKGVDLARNLIPDLILMDIQMPVCPSGSGPVLSSVPDQPPSDRLRRLPPDSRDTAEYPSTGCCCSRCLQQSE